MTSWLPHEEGIREWLKAAPEEASARFAAACAERHGLEYVFGPPRHDFERDLDVLWAVAAANPAYPSAATWSRAAQEGLEGTLAQLVLDEAQPSSPQRAVTASLAFNSGVAAVHAGLARVDDALDNAIWAARQLVESLFVAYAFRKDAVPSRELAVEFEMSDVFLREVGVLLSTLDQARERSADELREVARAGNREFEAQLRRLLL